MMRKVLAILVLGLSVPLLAQWTIETLAPHALNAQRFGVVYGSGNLVSVLDGNIFTNADKVTIVVQRNQYNAIVTVDMDGQSLQFGARLVSVVPAVGD